MRTLYLHIGQGKTGTSYLQSVFALNQARLADFDVDYPLQEAMLNQVAKGNMPGGNGYGLRDVFSNPETLSGFSLPEKRHVLLSHEGLISRLLFDGSAVLLDEICDKNNFDHVSILVFGRNPVKHVVSSYRQLVKRGGMTLSLDQYCDIYQSPKQLASFLEAYSGRPNTSVRALNYSDCSKHLLDQVAQWLNIDFTDFALPPGKIVNRSMTAGELFFQRELNKHMGDKAQILVDPLIEGITDLQYDNLLPAIEAQAQMIEKMSPFMEIVNKYFSDNHAYSEEIFAPHPSADNSSAQVMNSKQNPGEHSQTKFEFTDKQLSALAQIYVRLLQDNLKLKGKK